MKKEQKQQKWQKQWSIEKQFILLCSRYVIAIIVGFFIWVFYSIFTPPTLFLLEKFLKIFFDFVMVYKEIIIYKETAIAIIPACIGGSAYYLLFLLNLLTPRLEIKKRLLILIFTFSAFFTFNFLRLALLIGLKFAGYNIELYHRIFWYVGSTVFVFLIWLFSIKIFKISEIPVVADFLWLLKLRHRELNQKGLLGLLLPSLPSFPLSFLPS
ncbi:MAG: pacearchaeosortase [Candidatus Pacearchaeota archaeon]